MPSWRDFAPDMVDTDDVGAPHESQDSIMVPRSRELPLPHPVPESDAGLAPANYLAFMPTVDGAIVVPRSRELPLPHPVPESDAGLAPANYLAFMPTVDGATRGDQDLFVPRPLSDIRDPTRNRHRSLSPVSGGTSSKTLPHSERRGRDLSSEVTFHLRNSLLAGTGTKKRKAQSRKGKKHIDWTNPLHRERMDGFISAWKKIVEKSNRLRVNMLPWIDEMPSTVTVFEFKGFRKLTEEHNVPYSTARDRLKKEDPYLVPKRGRRPLFSDTDCNALADGLAALDHLNNGKDTGQVIDAISKACPQYSRSQIANAWHHTIKHSDILGRFRAQSSDRDRSGAVTELNQRFYFGLVETARDMAGSLSEGKNEDGQTWRDLEHFFTMGLDEESHAASAGSSYVVGARSKKKHENHNDESRMSITGVHIGTAAGGSGPAFWLVKGVGIPPEYANQFGREAWLVKKGAPRGSFVLPTPNAFMTNEAWDTAAPKIAKGIRAMVVICDHPEW
jgi:hypothetical protein